eukprot:6928171-Heterocapsa_arctica.AAC.1
MIGLKAHDDVSQQPNSENYDLNKGGKPTSGCRVRTATRRWTLRLAAKRCSCRMPSCDCSTSYGVGVG